MPYCAMHRQPLVPILDNAKRATRIAGLGGSPICARATATGEGVVDIIVNIRNGPGQRRGIGLDAGMGGRQNFMAILCQPRGCVQLGGPDAAQRCSGIVSRPFCERPRRSFRDGQGTFVHAVS